MTDYVKDLERQNEELKNKLSDAESRATDGAMAFSVLYHVLKNTAHEVVKSNNKTSITLDMSEVTITNKELDETSLAALEKLLEKVKKNKIKIRCDSLNNMGEIYKNLFLASCEDIDSIDKIGRTVGYVK